MKSRTPPDPNHPVVIPSVPVGLHYEQRVPPCGFEIVEDRKTRQRLIRPTMRALPDMTGRGPWKGFAPLNDALLYTEFAELDAGSEEAILSFAKKYGPLGVPHELPLDVRQFDIIEGHGEWERLATWQWEIRVMRQAIGVWERLSDKSASQPLSENALYREFKCRRWNDTGLPQGVFAPPNPAELLPTCAYTALQPSFGPELPGAPAAPGEPAIREFAWWLPCEDVRATHQRVAESFVQEVISCRLQAHVRVDIHNLPKGGLLRVVMPVNLLGALWWQVALWVEGLADHRRCERCCAWFTVSPHARGFGQRQRFCGDACRQRSHQAKLRNAPDVPRRTGTNRRPEQRRSR